MIDTQAYYDEDGGKPPRFGLAEGHDDQDNLAGETKEGHGAFTDHYAHYDDIDPYDCESLELDQYLICHFKIWAFVLKTRQWGKTKL